MLKIENLSLEIETNQGVLEAVSDFNLTIHPAEILCLVGESGCGKSITAQSLTRLNPVVHAKSGRVLLEGRDILTMSQKELREVRRNSISYIFQDPAVALNPAMRIGTQISECLKLSGKHFTHEELRQRTIQALREVGIPAPEQRINEYPHQLSGGMKQRVMIAQALVNSPKLLIADEPTTALDVTIQAQILDLIASLQHNRGMSVLLITHNLGIVARLADRVAVMYAGKIVEMGTADEVLFNAKHPYTKALLASVPQPNRNRCEDGKNRLVSIPGQVPPLTDMPLGCRFHPRCPYTEAKCRQQSPQLNPIAEGADHLTACPIADVNK